MRKEWLIMNWNNDDDDECDGEVQNGTIDW